MALYLISYDIKEANESEYEPLYKALEDLEATAVLKSVWVVVAELGISAELIYEALAKFIKPSDRLLVQETGKDSRWNNLLISNDILKGLLDHTIF